MALATGFNSKKVNSWCHTFNAMSNGWSKSKPSDSVVVVVVVCSCHHRKQSQTKQSKAFIDTELSKQTVNKYARNHISCERLCKWWVFMWKTIKANQKTLLCAYRSIKVEMKFCDNGKHRKTHTFQLCGYKILFMCDSSCLH